MTDDKHSRSRLAWVVGPEDTGARADVVLGRRVPGLSRRVARSLARAGALRIDDRVAPPWHHVLPGERLVLELETNDEAPVAAPLCVLATTADFLYVDKPAGTHTHRLRPDEPDALADAVLREFPECATASKDPREGGAVHRLDRATTGVVAFARSAEAWRRGRAAMADPRTRKLYVALACVPEPIRWPPRAGLVITHADGEDAWWRLGDLPQPQSVSPLRLELPLGRGARRESVMVRADGRPTRCDLVPLAIADALQADGRKRALLAVALGRGHRHQIRVYLAWLGMPIEGDGRYGGAPQPDAAGLALHCAALDLSASCPGEQRVEAALASAFARRLDQLPLRPWAGPEHTW